VTAFALLATASAGPAAISPGELLADPDRFDGQAVTLQGTVEKYREGVSSDGAPYYKFRLSDEQYGVRVFWHSQCRDGMQATVDGTFERVNRLGRRTHYNEVTATCVTCR
jgi:starvation-inducible outer membrane lipoprotein